MSRRNRIERKAESAIDDREWTARMAAALAGDDRAYRQLLADAAVLAAGVARRRLRAAPLGSAEVEDIVQETLLAVHAGRLRWRPEAGVAPWIATIARNKATDAVRRAFGRQSVPIDDERLCLAEPVREAPETRLDLARLMAPLRPRQREIVTQVMLRGRTLADTAQTLQMTAVAGRVTLHRAIRAMAAAANTPLVGSESQRRGSAA